ncbi:unnamed protein product [Caenorhabditis nigoni]
MTLCNGIPGPFTDEQKDGAFAIMFSLASRKRSSFPDIKSLIGSCSQGETDLLKSGCKKVMETTRDKDTIAYGLCCDELKVCSAPVTMKPPNKEEVEDFKKFVMLIMLDHAKTCSGIPTEYLDQDFIDTLLLFSENGMEQKSLPEIKKFLKTCTAKHKKVLKETCEKFYAKSEKSGDKESFGYNVCCKSMDIWPFYTQIWFFAVCGGVALLLIGIVGVVVYFFCIRKKGGGGKSGGGMKSSKKSTKKSKSKSEALF